MIRARAVAHELDREVYVGDALVLTDVVARETSPWRFAMRTLTGFAIVAACLATVGLAGMVSVVVSLRQREFGIRAALGATPRRLRLHVLADGLMSSAAGALVGLLVALVLGRLIGRFLVETSPYDPGALIGATALMISVGTAACLIPAQRAVDPRSRRGASGQLSRSESRIDASGGRSRGVSTVRCCR